MRSTLTRWRTRSLFLVWAPSSNVYNPDRIVKAVYRPDIFGIPRFDLSKVSVKRS